MLLLGGQSLVLFTAYRSFEFADLRGYQHNNRNVFENRTPESQAMPSTGSRLVVSVYAWLAKTKRESWRMHISRGSAAAAAKPNRASSCISATVDVKAARPNNTGDRKSKQSSRQMIHEEDIKSSSSQNSEYEIVID